MEEPEKMSALKKAYAEVILNTVKESAARVMLSERNALRFQRDLSSAREEGLRILLRLKQMFNSKFAETEIQRRQIGELEAQLQEAEEIILDLRMELESVQNELKMVKKHQMPPLKSQIAEEPARGEKVSENKLHAFKSIAFTSLKPGQVELMTDRNTSINPNLPDLQSCNAVKQVVPLSNSHLEAHLVDNPYLGPTVMRTEDPEMFNASCDQKVHVSVANVLDMKLPPGDINDQSKQSNLPITAYEKDEIEVISTSPKTSNEEAMVKINPVELKKAMQQMNCSSLKDQPLRIIHNLRKKRRKRGARIGNAGARACKPCSRKLSEPSQSPSMLINSEAYSLLVKCKASTAPFSKAGNMRCPLKLEEKTLFNCSYPEDKAVNIVQREHRKKKMEDTEIISALSKSSPGQLMNCDTQFLLSKCNFNFSSAYGAAKSNGDILKTTGSEAKMNPLRLNLEDQTPQMDESVSEELIDDSVLVNHGSDVGALVLGAKASEANGGPSDADNNSFFKYTFQRKRKKGPLSSSDGNSSSQKNASNKLVDKHAGALDLQKSSLIGESTCDSRRLAQVAACQLMSLSGETWC